MYGDEGSGRYGPDTFDTSGPVSRRLDVAGRATVTVSTVGRVVSVTQTSRSTLAVIEVGGKAFMIPVDSTQAGPMRRLQGLPVRVTIQPTDFARGVTGMGSHLLNRGR